MIFFKKIDLGLASLALIMFAIVLPTVFPSQGNYDLLHLPTNRKCPAGYQLVERMFRERDGSYLPGCAHKITLYHMAKSDGYAVQATVDYLAGYESVMFVAMAPRRIPERALEGEK